jgi:hypothetical protein
MDLTGNIENDFKPFADPATDLKLERGTQGARLQMFRNGVEHDYFFNLSDGSATARHLKGRRFPAIKSVLASPDFADIKSLAATQARMFRLFSVDKLIPPEGDIEGDRLSRTSFARKLAPGKEQETGKSPKIEIMLIDGPAGIGKTSLIQSALVQRARRYGEAAALPPILHVASRGRRLTGLNDSLAQSIQLVRAKFTFDQVPVLIRHGLLQIAIDGFDELVDPEGYRDAWFALRDFLDDVSFGGPIVLAGRDTFFDQQSFLKQIKRTEISLTHVRLQPSSPSTARAWLKEKGWNETDIKDPMTNIVLRPGSYSLRPYFLSVLAEAKSWRKIESNDLTPRAFLVENFLAREARLLSENLPLTEEEAKGSLNDLFEEIALEMANNENDTVDLGFLQLVTEVSFGGHLGGRDLAKLQHKAGSFALLESDAREDHRKFPHTEISYHFLASALIRNILQGAQVAFLRRGIIAADLLTIFAEQFLRLSTDAGLDFVKRCDRSLVEEVTFDRLSENLATLLLSTLCHQGLTHPRTYSDLAVVDAVIFGVAAPAKLVRIKCQRLDVREGQFSQVHFEDVEINTLIADETTRFGKTHPTIHQLLLSTPDGGLQEVFDPADIQKWLIEHSTLEGKGVENEDALRLFDRICRVMLRQHMIKEHPSDPAGRLLQDRYWKPIEKILVEAKLIDRLQNRGTSGAAASFLRLQDPFKLLVQRADNSKIRSVWERIGSIPIH